MKKSLFGGNAIDRREKAESILNNKSQEEIKLIKKTLDEKEHQGYAHFKMLSEQVIVLLREEGYVVDFHQVGYNEYEYKVSWLNSPPLVNLMEEEYPDGGTGTNVAQLRGALSPMWTLVDFLNLEHVTIDNKKMEDLYKDLLKECDKSRNDIIKLIKKIENETK